MISRFDPITNFYNKFNFLPFWANLKIGWILIWRCSCSEHKNCRCFFSHTLKYFNSSLAFLINWFVCCVYYQTIFIVWILVLSPRDFSADWKILWNYAKLAWRDSQTIRSESTGLTRTEPRAKNSAEAWEESSVKRRWTNEERRSFGRSVRRTDGQRTHQGTF